MLHPSTKKLIDRLAEMTGQKRIDWLAGDRDDTLVFDTEGYRVLLQGDPATLRLTDALGRELESASPDELAATPHDGGGTYGATMAALRREAQRIARGTEGAISAVLGGLDAEPVGKTPVLEADGLADLPHGRRVPTLVLMLNDAIKNLALASGERVGHGGSSRGRFRPTTGGLWTTCGFLGISG